MPKRILLICANQRQAVHAQVALLRCGCMVEVASTFRRGLAVIQHRPPTAVVVDEALPDLDSAQLARTLKVNGATAMPPVVMLALHESRTAPLQASALGGGQFAREDVLPQHDVVVALRQKGIL